MFVFLYSWIIYLPYHLVHIGCGPWVQTEKVMDLQKLNKLESVLQYLVPSENSDTTHWLRCVDAYCGNIVQGFYFLQVYMDDSSWVVACSCCRVFSIKCGFDIVYIIYMFSFLVEWWISTLVVARDLLFLVVYLVHPCMGEGHPLLSRKTCLKLLIGIPNNSTVDMRKFRLLDVGLDVFSEWKGCDVCISFAHTQR